MLRSFSKFAMSVLVVVCLSVEGVSGVITIPPDLAPGSRYYLTFVTGNGKNGVSSDITDYDNFVNVEAKYSTPLNGITWKALASTATTNAKNHINIGVFPVYRLDGVRVANSGDDLWDGALVTYININQLGNLLPNSFVLTGTNADGSSGTNVLGSATPTIGFTFRSDSGWVNHQTWPLNTGIHRYLAFSTLLTVPLGGAVVPEPSSTAIVAILLVGGALQKWRIRRRGHPQ